jgi:ABC-type amino acid transport substrate-binding protein
MKKIIKVMVIALVFILVSVPSFAKNHDLLNLVSPHFPPYSYEENNQILGVGPELIRRVMANTDIPYKITMVEDYGTAVHVIKAKLADGMFLASQSAERDAIAVFAKPLMVNKWSWFIRKDSVIDTRSAGFKLHAGIGSIRDTNTAKWLNENGYTIIALPVDAHSLVAMLKSHRIDAAFVADVVFENELSKQERAQFKKVVEVKKPFGLYLSRDYVNNHPDALKEINRSIEKVTR